MNPELVAIRDGKYDDAIDLAKNNLESNPGNIGSHFTLAQAYETKGASEVALTHVMKCLEVLPESFEALSLAARCSAKVEEYDSAFTYAERALRNNEDPNLPNFFKVAFNILSYIPGLGKLRATNRSVVEASKNQIEWLNEYVDWYNERQTSK